MLKLQQSHLYLIGVNLVQANAGGGSDISSSAEIEDLVYSFLAIMLEHSMRLKDGWKVCNFRIVCYYQNSLVI